MAKQNENRSSESPSTDGGDAGVLTDDELISELGLGDELGRSGAGSDEDADGDNGGETDEEEADGSEDGESDEGDESDDDDGESEGEEESTEDDSGDDDDGDGESDDEDSEEESEEDEPEEKLPRSVTQLQKRVRKLTKRAKTAEERVATLEPEVERLQGELSTAKAPIIAPTDENPLADLMTEAAVNDRVSKAKMIRRWCMANLEGGEVEGPNGKIELTAAQVRERLMDAEGVIDAAPKRVAHLQETAKADAYARRAYPALFKAGTPESRIVDDFLTQCPEITRLPNWRIIVGDALVGGTVRMQKAHAKPEKKPVKKPTAPRVAVRASAPKPAPAKQVSAAKSRAKFFETGSRDDLAAAIADGAL